MSADRIRVYNRLGIGLADLRVTVRRTWNINEEGDGEFDIVSLDANCRADYLRFGNWLLVENDGLEPWVGMIDEPQDWKQRAVTVSAYTPERLLLCRNVPRQLKQSGKPGAIFAQVINLCNYAEPTIVQVGNIWTGGSDMPAESMSGRNMLEYVKDLAKHSDCEFDFTPVATKGRLAIYANWYKRVGVDSNWALEESFNLGDGKNSMRLQGRAENELWGYGNGAGQASRPTAVVSDPDSIGLYGLRQGSRTYSEYADAGSVTRSLNGEINDAKEPHMDFKLYVLNENNTFNHVRKGNSHPLRIWSLAFGVHTRVRVKSIRYNPFDGGAEMLAEEIINVIRQ
jgi:hypothetical protein